jgi:hypothetical protein
MCVVDEPTKPPGKKRKYRRHHPMEIVPKGSFENLCICVRSNKNRSLNTSKERRSRLTSTIVHAMSFLMTRLLHHRRHLHAATIPIFSTTTAKILPPTLSTTTAKSNFHTSAAETVQIEIGLSEYSGNKKAVRTDGLLAKHQN